MMSFTAIGSSPSLLFRTALLCETPHLCAPRLARVRRQADDYCVRQFSYVCPAYAAKHSHSSGFEAEHKYAEVVEDEDEDETLEEQPDFDELILDDKYYKEMGIDEDERAELMSFSAKDLDPEGEDLTLDKLFDMKDGLPQVIVDELAHEELYGPEAVLLAGFRAEEVAMVRVVLDAAGGQAITVIPASQQLLYTRLEEAMHAAEPDWERPRPETWECGGGWGAQRTVVFSGISTRAQATLIELLEESGLPAICAEKVTRDNKQMMVGELLAQAVKTQRGRKNPRDNPWDDRVVEELPPIEKVLEQQTKAKMKELYEDVDDGSLDSLFEESGPGELSITLEDVKRARAIRLQEEQQKASARNEVAAEAERGAVNTKIHPVTLTAEEQQKASARNEAAADIKSTRGAASKHIHPVTPAAGPARRSRTQGDADDAPPVPSLRSGGSGGVAQDTGVGPVKDGAGKDGSGDLCAGGAVAAAGIGVRGMADSGAHVGGHGSGRGEEVEEEAMANRARTSTKTQAEHETQETHGDTGGPETQGRREVHSAKDAVQETEETGSSGSQNGKETPAHDPVLEQLLDFAARDKTMTLSEMVHFLADISPKKRSADGAGGNGGDAGSGDEGDVSKDGQQEVDVDTQTRIAIHSALRAGIVPEVLKRMVDDAARDAVGQNATSPSAPQSQTIRGQSPGPAPVAPVPTSAPSATMPQAVMNGGTSSVHDGVVGAGYAD